MIKFKNVSYTYPIGVVALRGINLTINDSERLGVIGQNGSGKTTLMKLCNGLLKPTKGDVYVNDINTKDVSIATLSKHVGYVFQNPDDQIFSSSIYEEVSFGPKNLGYDYKPLVKKALEYVKLWKYKDSHPYNFSYNTRKLIAIASILSMNTDVVILDEPTTGQDPQGKLIVSNIIKSIKKTFIVVSHDINFIADNCDRVIVLNNGKIVLDGPTEKVLSNKKLLTYGIKPPMITRVCEKARIKKFVRIDDLINYIANLKGK